MKKPYPFLSALLALAVVSLGCNALSSLPGSRPVLEDDFSNKGDWGTSTDSNSSVEYDDGGLRMQTFTKNYFIWSTPNTDKYENIHIEVTVENNDTDPTIAFGILCNQQTVTDLFYYFVITAAGEYAIAETSLTQSDVFLTNNDQWAASDLIPTNAPSYRMGADCGNGALNLYVEGKQVASVSDSTFSSGSVGLISWSGEEVASSDVTFDDFVVTKLK